jgi:hypothetical protein
MTTIAELAQTMQGLLTETADRLGRETGFIQRQRKVSGSGFAQATVFGWLANPAASYAELNQAAATVGVKISTQGLDQRFTPEACDFLRGLLAEGIEQMVTAAQPKALGVLERFAGVYLTDTSQVGLPVSLVEWWPGGGRQAGLKLAVSLELKHGQMKGPFLSAGRNHDQRTAVCGQRLPVGGLWLVDLGFFDLARLADYDQQGVYWLMRLKMGTHVYDPTDQPVNLVSLLSQFDRDSLDMPILLGRMRLSCRLLAWRVPDPVAQQRCQQAHATARRKQQPVSQARLALADWSLVITNIPSALLSVSEASVILVTRWQVETLFDLWKTEGQLDKTVSVNPWRVLASIYAKLLALLIQHWTTLVTAWQAPDLSLVQAAQVIRKHALHLASVLHDTPALLRALVAIQSAMSTCRMQKRRRHLLTFQLWLQCPDTS